MKDQTYRGRGAPEITEIIQKQGQALTGYIQRASGEHLADLEFDLVNGELHLTVNGETYTSITNALHELAPELASHSADGSEGSGNVANNVIGNYAILKHVMINAQSMHDILGGSSAGPARAVKARSVKSAKKIVKLDPRDLPAQGNLYDYFARDVIVKIARDQGGAEQFQAMIKGLSVKDFADQYGLTF